MGWLVLNFLVTLYAIVFDLFHILPSCGYIFQGKDVFPSTHIRCSRNAYISQRGPIWVYRAYTHEEMDGVVWFAPILVLVCCDAQDLHATRQCYEGVSMVGNQTVCNVWEENFVLVGIVEARRVGEWCSVRKVGCTCALILLFPIRWIHAAMDFSVWLHIDMVRW